MAKALLRCTALLLLMSFANCEQENGHNLLVELSRGSSNSPNVIPMRVEKQQILNNNDESTERHIVKRAPSPGFMAMRGKKDDEDADINYYGRLSLDPLSQDYGDDAGDVYSNGKRYKKAPTAFYGVRGKKYPNNGDLRHLGQLLQRLEEEQLRDNVLQDFIDRLAVNALQDNEIVSKRTPTGFNGMRGKRPLRAELKTDAVEDNGASSFVAELAQSERMEEMSKRAPANAFMGVRGKKDVSHQPYKRSAPEAFDTRGSKKQRFIDFGNKFVAVRGKKNIDLDTNAKGNQMIEGQGLNEPRYFANYPATLLDNGNKRAPSGFTGMRGKRPDSNNGFNYY